MSRADLLDRLSKALRGASISACCGNCDADIAVGFDGTRALAESVLDELEREGLEIVRA